MANLQLFFVITSIF